MSPHLVRITKEMTDSLPDEGSSMDAFALLKQDHRKTEIVQPLTKKH